MAAKSHFGVDITKLSKSASVDTLRAIIDNILFSRQFNGKQSRYMIDRLGKLTENQLLELKKNLDNPFENELIDEMDGVRRVGCYWVNRVSGMGIRSPFAFDHVNRILKFKGFADPIHESEIPVKKPPEPEWDAEYLIDSLGLVNNGYYSAIDTAMAFIYGDL